MGIEMLFAFVLLATVQAVPFPEHNIFEECRMRWAKIDSDNGNEHYYIECIKREGEAEIKLGAVWDRLQKFPSAPRGCINSMRLDEFSYDRLQQCLQGLIDLQRD